MVSSTSMAAGLHGDGGADDGNGGAQRHEQPRPSLLHRVSSSILRRSLSGSMHGLPSVASALFALPSSRFASAPPLSLEDIASSLATTKPDDEIDTDTDDSALPTRPTSHLEPPDQYDISASAFDERLIAEISSSSEKMLQKQELGEEYKLVFRHGSVDALPPCQPLPDSGRGSTEIGK